MLQALFVATRCRARSHEDRHCSTPSAFLEMLQAVQHQTTLTYLRHPTLGSEPHDGRADHTLAICSRVLWLQDDDFDPDKSSQDSGAPVNGHEPAQQEVLFSFDGVNLLG